MTPKVSIQTTPLSKTDTKYALIYKVQNENLSNMNLTTKTKKSENPFLKDDNIATLTDRVVFTENTSIPTGGKSEVIKSNVLTSERKETLEINPFKKEVTLGDTTPFQQINRGKSENNRCQKTKNEKCEVSGNLFNNIRSF